MYCMVKIKKRSVKSVVNVRSVVKETTNLNFSADALAELVELTEDFFVPLVVRLSEKSAKEEGKKTIQERDYLVAKDWITSAMKSYGLI